ncbi:hypothetical protein JG687_00012542 [Phytophthora cactorum]|uniref:Histone H4 n=1 Tax=Phytophthora cactorum TaxID=29920 RepID=A0A8T1U6W0_9STRA|nr:hypothetical protein JG687_00012542 [Phytophthora cactorum]
MAGHGQGAKAIRKGGSKRHRFSLRDNIQGISRPAIHRLARRAGVIRMLSLVYKEARAVLKVFVCSLMEHTNRKTATSRDVVNALKRQGRTLYGFDT